MNSISRHSFSQHLCIGVFLLFASIAVFGSRSVQELQSSGPSADTELPFELVGGRIYLPAEVNGHATTAILDTGAASSVIDLVLAKRWNLPSSGAVSANGGGSQAVRAEILRDTSVRIGNVEQKIEYAIPLAGMAPFEGRPLEVIVGTPFFSGRVIDIDYLNRRVRILGKSEGSPQGPILPIHFLNGLPHAQVSLVVGNKTYDLDALVDTGASATTLTHRFVSEHPLNLPMTSKTVTGGGVGGPVEGRYARPELLRIASIELRRPVLVASEAQSGADGLDAGQDLVLGSSVLQRFRVVVDYSHEHLTLVPNQETLGVFEADKSGLRIVAETPDLNVFKIASVLENSSSSVAGIQPGDVIESIDGIGSGQYRLWEIRELFRMTPPAGVWHLSLRRGRELFQITLPARSIV